MHERTTTMDARMNDVMGRTDQRTNDIMGRTNERTASWIEPGVRTSRVEPTKRTNDRHDGSTDRPNERTNDIVDRTNVIVERT